MVETALTRRPVSGVRIAGVACAVPGARIDVAGPNAHEDVKKIANSTGIYGRHIAPPEMCSSDLCQAAAERLLDSLGWRRESIDLLVFVSQTPDAVLPATACILHGKLGFNARCASFDVNLGCSGYVYGLQLVASLISTGQATRALLLVGDTMSKVTSPADRSVAHLFGDAGSATAVEAGSDAALMSFVVGTDGHGVPFLQIPSGGFRTPRTVETAAVTSRENGNARSAEHLFMDGAEIFNFTLKRVPQLISDVTAAAGWSAADVDAFVFHQANRFMLDHLAKRMKLPSDRVIVALKDVGNTSSASIPVAMVVGMTEQLTSRPMNLVLAGFGVGLSWAAVAFRSDQPVIVPLIEV